MAGNLHTSALNASFRGRYNSMAWLAVWLLLERVIPCSKSGLASIASEAALVPVVPYHVRYFSAQRLLTSSTAIVWPPFKIRCFSVPAVQTIGLSIAPFSKSNSELVRKMVVGGGDLLAICDWSFASCTIKASGVPLLV